MLTKLLKRLFDHDDVDPSMNKALCDALDGLKPGQAMHLTRISDGQEFTVMASDDFEHVAKLAGLKTKDLEMP